MKAKTLAGIGALSLVLAPFVVAAAPDAVVSNLQPAAAKSDNAKAAHGPVIDGERFDTRQITDSQQGGMAVGVVSVPEKWRFNSQVIWNYAHHSNPVAISTSVENPANEEALFSFPALQLFCLRPISGYYQPGQNVGGLIFFEQQPPMQTLAMFVQRTRGGLPKFQIVGSKDLPGLAAALRLTGSQNQSGVGVKVVYELNGKPVEEEFYAVGYSVSIPYDGPQGRTWQINWGLNGLHSFRAPPGTLDKRRAVFAAMAKSFRPNPTWVQRKSAIDAYLAQEFNRQLQAGYNQIAAAAQLSRQISANNDAMIASIDRQLVASRSYAGNSAGSQSRTSAENFDDYIRGVDTVNDPYYGTSQHASTEQYHWTDGYGSYRNSNDASYDANRSEVGSWQLMQPAR
jgi:hypothetical protein